MAFNPGGGGGGSLAGSSDVALTNVSNGQVVSYDSSVAKWKNKTPAASGGGSYPETRVLFSTLSGANDDAKFQNFIDTYRSVTFKPTLELDELRAYTFTQQHQIYSGFHLLGGGLGPVDQNRASSPFAQVVNLRLTGGNGWLTLPTDTGTIFGVSLVGLSFDLNQTSRVIHPTPGCVIWTSVFRDISFQNGLSFIGSVANAQPIDGCTFEGWWNMNNVKEVAFSMGGSDNRFMPTLMNLDSPGTYMPEANYLTIWKNMSKSELRGFYVTADRHSAWKIEGTNSMLRINNCDFEGRNAGQPCYGALLRISSDVMISECWTSYAMSNPSATGNGDLGVIHITDGIVILDKITYKPATGVAQSVPHIYVSGGNVRIRNMIGVSSSGDYFKPVVRHVGGAIDVDNSVTVVTV